MKILAQHYECCLNAMHSVSQCYLGINKIYGVLDLRSYITSESRCSMNTKTHALLLGGLSFSSGTIISALGEKLVEQNEIVVFVIFLISILAFLAYVMLAYLVITKAIYKEISRLKAIVEKLSHEKPT